MSEEVLRANAQVMKILAKAFTEAAEVYQNASQRPAQNGANGARHKEKAAVKLEQQQSAAAGAAASPSKPAGKDDKAEKAKKKIFVDADGNELKRPLSAYMLYNNHRRPILRAEHPELILPDISRLIGDEWKKLSDNQRNVWKEKANYLRHEFNLKAAQREVAQGETKAAAAAAASTTHQENGAVTMTQQSVKPDKNVDADSLSSFSDGNDEPKQQVNSQAAKPQQSAQKPKQDDPDSISV